MGWMVIDFVDGRYEKYTVRITRLFFILFGGKTSRHSREVLSPQ